ncbi:MAG: hydantoinase B/oxoprolinase family protein [Deltaproteobacteria bacterium]|nr:hydantoinase B/oxoprolinase family protein [Deltaproteobacteria bacterium]
MQIDAITLEVFWNRLVSIVNEQAAALVRASFTTIVRETEDLSSGIFDPAGNMLVQATTGTPGHINSMATGVKYFLKKYPPSALNPGDALVTNDPWLVSGHKRDLTVVSPIFFGGRLVALAANTCHVADIGGRGFCADATTVFEEGLHIPIVKLFDRGEPVRPVFEFIESNVRVPHLVVGDTMAQISANEVSGRKLIEFLKEVGLPDLEALAREILTRSEQATRRAIEAVPDGSASRELFVDGFEAPLKIQVTVTIKGSDIYVDYAGTSPQCSRGINVVFNYTHAYTTYALKCAICPDVPNNDGSFRPIHVVAPAGCLLNATYPAPVAGRHLIGHFAGPAIFGALAEILPDRVVADSSSLCISQFDGETDAGERFVNNYFCTGGMGARPTKDGLSTTGFPTNISNSPVEVTENVSPIFFVRKELICDSGGPGRFRGGLAQRVGFRIRSARPAAFNAMFERTKFPALGFRGGGNGRLAEVTVPTTGERPHPKSQYTLQPGHEVQVDTSGGGGFFPPFERDPLRVLEDVLDGLVSVERAAADYGVAIDRERLEIDWPRTRALRGQSGS